MAKDKKKKEKKEKKKKQKKQKTGQKGDTFSQLYAKKGKITIPRVSLGNSVDRSGDKLFLGTDYREVHIPEIPWV